MEPYKAHELPIKFEITGEIIKLLNNAREAYGEYKGYLKNMSYDYKSFLETSFINEIYYSFKIDNSKLEKEEMFLVPYKNKNNETIIYNNMKHALLSGVSLTNNLEFTLETFNRLNKVMFNNCSKNSKTKGSGHLRKIQTYILKPGIAGSSVSFIPPIYTSLNSLMKNLCDYINAESIEIFLDTCITHYQFMRIQPYVSENGKLARLLIPIQISHYKKEAPILFISESIDNLKNTYLTLLSNESDNLEAFIKFILECIIDQCNRNIKKIKKLNKIYLEDLETFKNVIGGTTIYKVFPFIAKKICFTTNDVVTECKLHINSVNKVLNKLVDHGFLIKEKKKGTNRVTFTYNHMLEVFSK